jgi:hypothetical protein
MVTYAGEGLDKVVAAIDAGAPPLQAPLLLTSTHSATPSLVPDYSPHVTVYQLPEHALNPTLPAATGVPGHSKVLSMTSVGPNFSTESDGASNDHTP